MQVDTGTLTASSTGENCTLFRFADLVLQGRDFFLHFAQFHVCNCAARLVKEINNCAGNAADEDDEETKRANEDGCCFRVLRKGR